MIYQNLNYDIEATANMVDVINAFMRGLEKPLILWLISQGPKHGYELIKEFKRLTGQKLKPGALYPLLYRLEDEGFVASEWIKKGRRDLKYYSLTEKGKDLLMKVRSLFGESIRGIIADLLSENR
ncbi:MAG: PadR family transcriptional regulator [Candidatus Bathyarchaeales archaeon]